MYCGVIRMPEAQGQDWYGEENPKEPWVQGIQYGRRWKITIFKPAYKENAEGKQERDPEHDVEMDVSLLRCIFKTQFTKGTPVQIGTLVVYNMNAATEKEVIQEGFQISIEGGYEEAQYGHIYTGDIVQVIRNRENGIDYRLEILAIRSSLMFDTNHVRASIAAQAKPREVVETVCKQADKEMAPGEISDNISQQPLPRGKVIFGTAGKYLRDIAIANNAWFGEDDEGKVYMRGINDEIPQDKCLELTPNTGLVGTPKYTDGGIQIKMLLDARVKIDSLIKIDNELIQRQLINVDQKTGGMSSNQQPQANVFDKDGEYQVFSVAHAMDTHGNDWSTEVLGISRNGRTGLPATVESVNQSMVV